MTFILFGLTVVASSMNLLVLRFLTMNTEDERREEIQSAVARSSLRFDSDLLNPNGKSSFTFELRSTRFFRNVSPFDRCRAVRLRRDRIDAVGIGAVSLFRVFQTVERRRPEEVHRASHAGQSRSSRSDASARVDFGETRSPVHTRVSPLVDAETFAVQREIVARRIVHRSAAAGHVNLDQLVETLSARQSLSTAECPIANRFSRESPLDFGPFSPQTLFRLTTLFRCFLSRSLNSN